MKFLSRVAPKLAYLGGVTILLVAMGFVGLYLAVGPGLPEVDSIRKIRLQTPMRVYSAEGTLIAEFGDTRRIPITLDQVPRDFINALLSTEDQRFYEHSGVDFQGLVRAFLKLITTQTKSEGASTITMQVARNYYLSRAKRFSRKITEIFLAWKIESELSKNEILELYLNKIHFSHRAYGLGAASQVYYGTTLENLSLAQLATLAGIPKGESKYNPISSPENATRRRAHVLGRMLAEGHITQKEHDSAAAESIETQKHGTSFGVEAPFLAEMVRLFAIEEYGQDVAYNDGLKFYTTLNTTLQDYARTALTAGLESYDRRHGYRGPEHQYQITDEVSESDILSWLQDIETIANLQPAIVTQVSDETAYIMLKSGLKAQINLDGLKWARKYVDENHRERAPIKTPAQVLAQGDLIRVTPQPVVTKTETEKNAADTEISAEEELIETLPLYQLSQIPDISGGFVVLNPDTGAVEALVGDYDYKLSQYNNITQAERQPGSNIKPFIYSAAFEKQYNAASLLNDMPITEVDVTAENIWRPKNDSNNYSGQTSLRTALRLSKNTVSVRLIRDIGPKFAKSYLTKIGFPADKMPPFLSLALGSPEFTPLQVVTGYATLANGGFKVDPWFVARVENASGRIIFEHQPITACLECEKIVLQDLKIAELTKLDAGSMENSDLIDNELPASQNPDGISNLPRLPVAENLIAPRVIEARNHYIITDILKDAIHRGTATRTLANSKSPLLKRNDIAGKTGTTNGPKDAWFTGFNRDYVATAWVGFKDHSRKLGNREYGGKSALPIWQKFMEKALHGKPERDFAQPPGIESVRIDPKTGKLATELTETPKFEMFRVENAPKEYADKPLHDPYGDSKDKVSDDDELF